jgi:hypothetical protein
MAIRGYHEVTIIIRKFIHDDKVELAPIQNKPFLIFLRVFGKTENAGVRFGAEDVLKAPWCP